MKLTPEEIEETGPCKDKTCYNEDGCELAYCAFCDNIFSGEGSVRDVILKSPEPTDPSTLPFNECPVCGGGILYLLCNEHRWRPGAIPGNILKKQRNYMNKIGSD